MSANTRSKSATAEIINVSPRVAEQMLGMNSNNRSVRSRKVSQYATDMRSGNWKLTGEAIKFDKTGRMLDGQHRCLAVIESGATVPMFVIRGLDEDTQNVMDTGAARGAGDMLSLRGYQYATLVAAGAKWCYLFDNDRLYVDSKAQVVTHAQILEYVEATPLLMDAAARATAHRLQIDLQPSILTAALVLTGRVDAEDSDVFFARLADGIDLPVGSPILALASRLREIRRNRVRVDPIAQLSLTIRAWNAWREDRSLLTIPIYRGSAAIRCPQPK